MLVVFSLLHFRKAPWAGELQAYIQVKRRQGTYEGKEQEAVKCFQRYFRRHQRYPDPVRDFVYRAVCYRWGLRAYVPYSYSINLAEAMRCAGDFQEALKFSEMIWHGTRYSRFREKRLVYLHYHHLRYECYCMLKDEEGKRSGAAADRGFYRQKW